MDDIERNIGVKKRFYRQDLQVVVEAKTKVKPVKRFAISALYNPRIDEDGVVWYLVAWKNYRKRTDRTYMTRDRLQIDAPKLLKAFEKRNNVRFIYAGKANEKVKEIRYDKNSETESRNVPTVAESLEANPELYNQTGMGNVEEVESLAKNRPRRTRKAVERYGF